MKYKLACWIKPTKFVTRYEGSAKDLQIAYGWPGWPSRSVWIMPGTIEE